MITGLQSPWSVVRPYTSDGPQMSSQPRTMGWLSMPLAIRPRVLSRWWWP